jgi:hypothetical protein
MVDLTKMRWQIERDYLELKQEVGLGHYEGRGWRCLHHYASLCIAAYGFLVSEKETIHPLRTCPRLARLAICPSRRLSTQGAAAAFTTPHAELNRHAAYPPRTHPGSRPASMPCCGRMRQWPVEQIE